MAALHRYKVRIQYWRTIDNMLAQNDQHAKTLAEDDTALPGDYDRSQATQATLIQSNAGNEGNGTPLHLYEVRVRARRNNIVFATDKQDARYWAEQDIISYGGSDTYQIQQVRQMAENVGSTE